MENNNGEGILSQIDNYPKSNYTKLEDMSDEFLNKLWGEELTKWIRDKEKKFKKEQLAELKARRIYDKPEYRLRKKLFKRFTNEK